MSELSLLLDLSPNFPAPLLENLRHQNQAELERLLARWTEAFGAPAHSVAGDFERWVEYAYRFDAATEAFGATNTTVRTKGQDFYNLATNSPVNEPLSPDFVFGPVGRFESRSHSVASPDGMYWRIPAFKKFAGRRWALAGYHPESGQDLIKVLQQLFDEGVRKFVVKGTHPKTGIWVFELSERPVDYFSLGMPGDLTEVVGYHYIGASEVFLVQEWILMVDEYRLFMVGPRPVSGAGCIEHHTPLDNDGQAFDSKVSGIRSSPAVRADQDCVNSLLEFGFDAGQEFFAQAPSLGDIWVMDVAINADTGEPAVVELNPARNSGLYASQPSRWMQDVHNRLMERQCKR